MAFDPNQHMMNLKGKSYLPVAARLAWLREQHPDAHVITDLREHEPGYALFMATVTLPDGGGSATGWGSETVKDFPDYLEKAETKALGRALAALGFGTLHASELDEGGAVADSPVERRPTSASAGAPIQALAASNLAPTPPLMAGSTTEQRAGFLKSMHEIGVSAAVAMDMVRHVSGLTFEEAERGHLLKVWRAAGAGTLQQVDGRWHVAEPPSAEEAPMLATELAAAMR